MDPLSKIFSIDNDFPKKIATTNSLTALGIFKIFIGNITIYPYIPSNLILPYQPSIGSSVSTSRQTQARKGRGEEERKGKAETEKLECRKRRRGRGERQAKREWCCEKAQGDETGKNPGGQWREISGNIRHGECGDVDLVAEIHACRETLQPTVNAVERVHDKFNLLDESDLVSAERFAADCLQTESLK